VTDDPHLARIDRVLDRLDQQGATLDKHTAMVERQGERSDRLVAMLEESLASFKLQLQQSNARSDRVIRENTRQLRAGQTTLEDLVAESRAQRRALLDRLDNAA
jgi:hypothetical protein